MYDVQYEIIMSDNIKIRAELLHSDICNKILAMCSGNFDMIPSYHLLDAVFKVIETYYNNNAYDINKVRDHLMDKQSNFDGSVSFKDISGDKKLLKCYSILFSLTKRKDDIKKKLPVCKFISNIIKMEQLTETLTQYVSIDIQHKKTPMGWFLMVGGILFTVGLFGFMRSTNPQWSLGAYRK
jgi:hypothetical protein